MFLVRTVCCALNASSASPFHSSPPPDESPLCTSSLIAPMVLGRGRYTDRTSCVPNIETPIYPNRNPLCLDVSVMSSALMPRLTQQNKRVGDHSRWQLLLRLITPLVTDLMPVNRLSGTLCLASNGRQKSVRSTMCTLCGIALLGSYNMPQQCTISIRALTEDKKTVDCTDNRSMPFQSSHIVVVITKGYKAESPSLTADIPRKHVSLPSYLGGLDRPLTACRNDAQS